MIRRDRQAGCEQVRSAAGRVRGAGRARQQLGTYRTRGARSVVNPSPSEPRRHPHPRTPGTASLSATGQKLTAADGLMAYLDKCHRGSVVVASYSLRCPVAFVKYVNICFVVWCAALHVACPLTFKH